MNQASAKCFVNYPISKILFSFQKGNYQCSIEKLENLKITGKTWR